MNYKIAVLGGGVSGTVLSKEISSRTSCIVDLYERSKSLGGLNKSIRIEKMIFDIGPFIFWEPFELFETFPSLKNHFIPVDLKIMSITPGGKYDKYPVSILGYLKNNGIFVFVLSVVDLMFSKIKYRKKETVSSYIKFYTGNIIYEKSGLKYYVERFYGLKDDDISLSFAQQRLNMIKDYSPFRYLKKIFRTITSKKDNRSAIVRSKEGFSVVYERIGDELKKLGVKVRLNADTTKINKTECGKFKITANGKERYYDHVISTIPIPSMISLIGGGDDLRLRTLKLLTLFYTGDIKQNASIIYNHTEKGMWKRITVYSKFYGTKDNLDYLSVGITFEKLSDNLISKARNDFEKHIEELSLFNDTPVFLGSVITDDAYPLFKKDMEDDIEECRNKLTSFGVDIVGRQGNFEYLFTSNAAVKAKELAENIIRDINKK